MCWRITYGRLVEDHSPCIAITVGSFQWLISTCGRVVREGVFVCVCVFARMPVCERTLVCVDLDVSVSIQRVCIGLTVLTIHLTVLFSPSFREPQHSEAEADPALVVGQ